MTFGREWDNERELSLKYYGDAEKMLEVCIYNHMNKRNLHDVAKVFAKEANIDTSQLMHIEENMLTEWWEVFWPIFCSSLSNKVKVDIVTEENYMFYLSERDAEEILHMYIYHYMKKHELHEAAQLFSEKANFEMLKILDYDESLLKEWWEVFWSQFFSKMTRQPGGNPQSSAQPSLGEHEFLSSLKRCHQMPTKNSTEHVSNVVGQPPEVMSQATQEMSERRAGKRPINMDTFSILVHSSSKEKGKSPLGFPPVKLLPTEMTQVSHRDNLSLLKMPVTFHHPPQVVGDYQSVQLESTFPAVQDSVYPPATSYTGESYRKEHGLLSGVGVNEPDGHSHDLIISHVTPTFSEFMQKEAEKWRQSSNSSLDKAL